MGFTTLLVASFDSENEPVFNVCLVASADNGEIKTRVWANVRFAFTFPQYEKHVCENGAK